MKRSFVSLAGVTNSDQNELQNTLKAKQKSADIRKMDACGSYYKLKTIHDLHKKIVRKCTHNAMSPLSAISGYLELMDMSLKRGDDIERIERYRTKIEEGINDLSKIVKEINMVYRKADTENEISEERLAS